jgi:hypothetical protein
MQKFQRAEAIPMSEDTIAAMAKQFNLTVEQVKAHQKTESERSTIWINDKYQVVRKLLPAKEQNLIADVYWLSIKRLDKEPIHDWRDLQQIKNELVDPEIEMWECYPKESQLVDTANQYHLWGFATTTKIIPFGFTDGRKVIDHDPEIEKATNTKQRKL